MVGGGGNLSSLTARSGSPLHMGQALNSVRYRNCKLHLSVLHPSADWAIVLTTSETVKVMVLPGTTALHSRSLLISID